MDSKKTGLSGHCLVVGASGSGKTRSIVSPNIVETSGSSYVISDPKGSLYERYASYLRKKGYTVRKINFSNPGDKDSCHYNPLFSVKSEQDVLSLAHLLSTCTDGGTSSVHYTGGDPFWDESATLLLQALIGYIVNYGREEERRLQTIMELIREFDVDDFDEETRLDLRFRKVKDAYGDVFPVRRYQEFRQAPERTLLSILITLSAKLGRFDSEELRRLMSSDDVDIRSVGMEKTALFVIVSDRDRSMDALVNVFFSQCIDTLCDMADRNFKSHSLPIPVRFIMDDFATNCKIENFPRIISSVRSRGISFMLLLQAESQLRTLYGDDSLTVIGNCDSYVYLGGSDLETARHIAERCDVPLEKILYMPVHTCIVFRRGQRPVFTRTIDFEKFEMLHGVQPQIRSNGDNINRSR